MYNLSFEGDERGDATDRRNAVNSSCRTMVSTPAPAPLPTSNPDQITQMKSKDDATKVYDPYDHGKKANATSFWGIVGHLIVISLGPTLLAIPATFVGTGYVTGVLGTVATVSLYAHCMRTMLSTEYELCKRLNQPNMTYLAVVKNAFDSGPIQLRWCSKYVQIVVYAVFLSVWVGGNSVTFILAGQNLKNAFDYFFDVDVAADTFNLYLILPLIVLSWIPSLKMLVPLSTFTNAVNAVCILLILYYNLVDLPSFDARPMFTNWTGISVLIGVQLFSINATCLIIPFKNELKYPKKFRSTFGVITVAYLPVCVIFSIFGLLCYIKYGEDSQNSIILNLPANTFNKTMVALYGVGNCFFFSLVSYASYDVIWNNLLKNVVEKLEHPAAYQYVCRSLICITSITLALAIPNLSLFLSVTGTVGTSIDSLIVPAMTEMLVYYKQGKYLLYAKDCLILLFAGTLIVMGGIDCVKQLLQTYQ